MVSAVAEPPMTQAFGQWLRGEVWSRQMGVNEFARRVGTSANTVSLWFNTDRKPRPQQCYKIAEVLKIDPEAVLTKAGHPARRSDRTGSPVNFLQDEFDRLSTDQQDELWDHIEKRRREREQQRDS